MWLACCGTCEDSGGGGGVCWQCTHSVHIGCLGATLCIRSVMKLAETCPFPAPPADAHMPTAFPHAFTLMPPHTSAHTRPLAHTPPALQVPPASCQGALGDPGCAGVQIHPGRQGRQRRHLQPLAPVQPQRGGGGAHAVWRRSHLPLCHGEVAGVGNLCAGADGGTPAPAPILLLLLLLLAPLPCTPSLSSVYAVNTTSHLTHILCALHQPFSLNPPLLTCLLTLPTPAPGGGQRGGRILRQGV